MSYKFTKTLTKVVFGIALACYIAAAYIMNRGGNASCHAGCGQCGARYRRSYPPDMDSDAPNAIGIYHIST